MAFFQLTRMPDADSDNPELEEWRAILRHLIASVEALGQPYMVHDQVWAEPRADAITIQSHQYGPGKNLWHVKKAYLPDYVYFDREGYSGWAEIAHSKTLFDESQRIDARIAEDFYQELLQRYVQQHKSKWKQSDAVFNAPNKPYIFYPLQRPSDTVMRLAYMDWLTLLNALVAYAEKHDICLVVKRHPRCDESMVEDALQALKNHPNVVRTDASIHAVIPNASAVFVINSGVGFESLMHLKPVFTAGGCDYHWVTHVLKDREQIERLPWPISPPVSDVAMKKFLYYFCCRYLVDIRDEKRTREMVERCLIEYRYGRWMYDIISRVSWLKPAATRALAR